MTGVTGQPKFDVTFALYNFKITQKGKTFSEVRDRLRERIQSQMFEETRKSKVGKEAITMSLYQILENYLR